MLFELNDSSFITAFSKDMKPVLTVPDGATVRIRTIDCYSNNLRADNDPRGAAPGPVNSCNPATGPIFVEGAHPGDTLKCEILAIDADEYSTMRVRPGAGFMGHRVTEKTVRAVRVKDGMAELGGVKLPVDPMIGVIGVAPAGEAIDTETPEAHGGNMDTRQIHAGSTLYLPVQAEGALFAAGDVHAQMGDGEMGICGLECPAWVTVRLSVIPGRQEKWPVLEDQGSIFTIASAETLEEASRLAADAMLDYLLARVNIDVNELVLLMSLICDLEVSQVVDPLVTARVRLRPGIMNAPF